MNEKQVSRENEHFIPQLSLIYSPYTSPNVFHTFWLLSNNKICRSPQNNRILFERLFHVCSKIPLCGANSTTMKTRNIHGALNPEIVEDKVAIRGLVHNFRYIDYQRRHPFILLVKEHFVLDKMSTFFFSSQTMRSFKVKQQEHYISFIKEKKNHIIHNTH